MTTPAEKRIAEIADTVAQRAGMTGDKAPKWFAEIASEIVEAALSDSVLLASVRDAAYEKAAQTCEARIMPQPDDIDCQEANWNSEAQGCANFIRALKTAPKG